MNSRKPEAEQFVSGPSRGYFEHDADIGIIGRGTTVEQAFNAERGGVISDGGVGFDMSCGIRCLRSNLDVKDAEQKFVRLADALSHAVATGVAEEGEIKLTPCKLDEVMQDGAQWAVSHGYGDAADIEYIKTAVGLLAPTSGTFRNSPRNVSGARWVRLVRATIISKCKWWSIFTMRRLGWAMSRHQALARWKGRALVDELAQQGMLIRTRPMRAVAEEAPGAYKDVDLVAEATEQAGLAGRVALLRPKVCIQR
jgi:RNA-splicing ligase RtcB